MDNLKADMTELSLNRIKELKAIQGKFSLTKVIDDFQKMNEALIEIIYTVDPLDASFGLTNKAGYVKSDEIRLKAIDHLRKNYEFMYKITSIPLELATKTQEAQGFIPIETINPLALPSGDDDDDDD